VFADEEDVGQFFIYAGPDAAPGLSAVAGCEQQALPTTTKPRCASMKVMARGGASAGVCRHVHVKPPSVVCGSRPLSHNAQTSLSLTATMSRGRGDRA
jgi:hypothetical protein